MFNVHHKDTESWLRSIGSSSTTQGNTQMSTVETKTSPRSHENERWVMNRNGVAPCTLTVSVQCSAYQLTTLWVIHQLMK